MSESNMAPVVPEGSTVSAGSDKIEFTTPDGQTGEVTEYGSVLHGSEDAPAESQTSEAEKAPQDLHAVEQPDEVEDDDFGASTFGDSHGQRGRVSKDKK